MKRRGAGLHAVTILLLLLWGCDREEAADDRFAPPERRGPTGTELRRGNGPEPASLEPHHATGTPEYNILRDLYEGLVGEAADGTLVPGVAEKWTVSDGGRRYTFVLREDAAWSDCEPVTAADFVEAFRRAVDPATASPNSFLLESIRGAAAVIAGDAPAASLAVTAEEPRKLTIELETPGAHFPAILTHAISYPFREGAESNGPYRLSERRPWEYVRLIRNECYWDAPNVAIDIVYFHVFQDIAAEVNAYRAGELDFTSEIPNSLYGWLRDNLGEQLHVAPYLSTYAYVVNITQPPFVGRPDLRKALSMAIDRETLVEHVTGVGERPAYSWVPPGTANYTSQPYQWADLSADERIAEAQQLYRSAGGDGETSPVISLRYDASPNHSRNAEVLSAMWRQTLDATIEPTSKEWKVFLSERHLLELGGLTRLGWVADYNDAQTFLEIFTSRHPQNVTGYADAEYDALIEAARQQTDPQQRRALLEQAERRLLEAYVVIPLYFNVSKHLVKPYIKGFVPNAMNRNQSKHLRLRE